MTADEIIAECRRLNGRRTKPTLPEVRPLIDAYYALDGNDAGGGLHIVLDDGNTDRDSIRWCIANAGGPLTPANNATRWLGQLLLLLSNSQRRRM